MILTIKHQWFPCWLIGISTFFSESHLQIYVNKYYKVFNDKLKFLKNKVGIKHILLILFLL